MTGQPPDLEGLRRFLHDPAVLGQLTLPVLHGLSVQGHPGGRMGGWGWSPALHVGLDVNGSFQVGVYEEGSFRGAENFYRVFFMA